MAENKEPSEMTIKEFMEWYVSEYEDNALMPSDFVHSTDRLEGYALAKQGSAEYFILDGALTDLRTARNFFQVVMMHAKWKYK